MQQGEACRQTRWRRHRQVKPRHHAREHVDRQRDPWAPDGLAGFFIDNHNVYPSMVDLNDLERSRCDIVAGHRLRGLDRGLVLAAQRHRAHVKVFDPRLDRRQFAGANPISRQRSRISCTSRPNFGFSGFR
jgi:hypothetical protein